MISELHTVQEAWLGAGAIDMCHEALVLSNGTSTCVVFYPYGIELPTRVAFNPWYAVSVDNGPRENFRSFADAMEFCAYMLAD